MKNLTSLLFICSLLSLGYSIQTTSYNQYAHDATSAIFSIHSSMTPMTQNADTLYDINFEYSLTNIPDLIYGLNQYMQKGNLSGVILTMTI